MKKETKEAISFFGWLKFVYTINWLVFSHLVVFFGHLTLLMDFVGFQRFDLWFIGRLQDEKDQFCSFLKNVCYHQLSRTMYLKVVEVEDIVGMIICWNLSQ